MMFQQALGFLWFKDSDPWWATILRIVVMTAFVVIVLVRSVDYVHAGEKAIVTRWGAVRKYDHTKPAHVKGQRIWKRFPFRYRRDYAGHKEGQTITRYPGFTWLNPLSDKNRKGPDAVLPIELSTQTRLHADGYFYEEVPWVKCWIKDIERALIDNKDWAIQFGSTCDEVYRIMLQAGQSIDVISKTLLDDPRVVAEAERLGIEPRLLQVRTSNPASNFILREARPATEVAAAVPAGSDEPENNGVRHMKVVEGQVRLTAVAGGD